MLYYNEVLTYLENKKQNATPSEARKISLKISELKQKSERFSKEDIRLSKITDNTLKISVLREKNSKDAQTFLQSLMH